MPAFDDAPRTPVLPAREFPAPAESGALPSPEQPTSDMDTASADNPIKVNVRRFDILQDS
jgi:hypothetical protein